MKIQHITEVFNDSDFLRNFDPGEVQDITINGKVVGRKHEDFTVKNISNGYVVKIHLPPSKNYIAVDIKINVADNEGWWTDTFELDDKSILYFDNKHKLHRNDGPALLTGDGEQHYFLHGKWQKTLNADGTVYEERD